MATAELLPIYTKLSQKILRKAARRPEASSYRESGGSQIVEGLDLFWLSLRCPNHAWTWPRANNDEHFEGFDAHQTCHKCISRRMFNTQKWQSGPVYRRIEPGTVANEAYSADFGKKAERSLSSAYFVDWIRSWTT